MSQGMNEAEEIIRKTLKTIPPDVIKTARQMIESVKERGFMDELILFTFCQRVIELRIKVLTNNFYGPFGNN